MILQYTRIILNTFESLVRTESEPALLKVIMCLLWLPTLGAALVVDMFLVPLMIFSALNSTSAKMQPQTASDSLDVAKPSTPEKLIPQEQREKIFSAYKKYATSQNKETIYQPSSNDAIEIFTQTVFAFSAAAKERGEQLSTDKLNFIGVYFIHACALIGHSAGMDHMRHEAGTFVEYGLRQEYKKCLSLDSGRITYDRII